MAFYETRQHPKSGDTYAVEVNKLGTIIRAAGPLHHADPTDAYALSGWLDNADQANDDGSWLEAEMEKQRT